TNGRPPPPGTAVGDDAGTAYSPARRNRRRSNVESEALSHQDAIEDIGRNDSGNPTFDEVVAARLSRRTALRALASTAIVGALVPMASRPAAAQAKSSLTFREVSGKPAPTHAVAPGYRAVILIRWGDPVVAGAPAFDVHNLSAAT